MTTIILAIVCLAQLGVNFALVNRLLIQAGSPAMKVPNPIEDALGPDKNAKIIRNRIPAGSLRVGS